MRTFILSGGQGTRLAPVIGDDIPKCLAPINGKPLIDYQIDDLRAQDITDITLCIGHLAPEVVRHLGSSVRYSIEDKPLGTGGALKMAIYGIEPVLVMNGDTLAKINYNDMLKKHVANNRLLTIARDKNKVSAGVYILNPIVLDNITLEAFSFENDVIPNTKHSFYKIDEFLDIGTPEGYARANA